jgi:hypothetical protein
MTSASTSATTTWGWTTVNYTSEGLILDVFANDQSALSPVSSLQLMRDDLSASDDD